MRYDLHVHTYFSPCSGMDPAKILEVAKAKGLDGIAITDHNTIKGGLACKKFNKDKGFEVIVGAEIMTPHGEILGYFLKEEIESREFFSVIDEIHKQGGIAVSPHPAARFRKGGLGYPYEKIVDRIDAIEGLNGRSVFCETRKAQKAAKETGLPMTAGSDAHFYYEIGRVWTEFEGSLRDAIKKGTTGIGGSTVLAPIGLVLSAIRKRIYRLFRVVSRHA